MHMSYVKIAKLFKFIFAQNGMNMSNWSRYVLSIKCWFFDIFGPAYNTLGRADYR